jgi:hemolysin-activating ACP:hemolysin acyltransferase
VGSHLEWHSTVCWPLRGGRDTQYTQNPQKYIGKKKIIIIKRRTQGRNIYICKYILPCGSGSRTLPMRKTITRTCF